MSTMASIIDEFSADFMEQYKDVILLRHIKALHAMQSCRNSHSPRMRASCSGCGHSVYIPHSCGHRNCPHCQHHESQQWLERQLQLQVPAQYYMITFTLPAQLRSLAWHNQRMLYGLMFQSIWETLRSFSANDKQLHGSPGVTAVLHTHSRALAYHPHIHVVMPAAAVDNTPGRRQWRTKTGNYLFHHKALAAVFRGKMLDALIREGFRLPHACPQQWVVNCKAVGNGDKALVYLGRYLYRGVIREKDIVACCDGKVTYRYRDSETGKYQYRTVSGEKFLWLVLQHVLPKGFRRARSYGFLHPNSKQLIKLLHYLLGFDAARLLRHIKPRAQIVCSHCGATMQIVCTMIAPKQEKSCQRLT